MASRNRHSLKRRRAGVDPKRTFFLICEGSNTEPGYFQAVRKAYADAIIRIEIMGGAGVPYTIAELAVTQAKKRGLQKNSSKKLDSFEEEDQIWAVFDRDEHPRYNEAVSICEQSGVGVARSNPCFEVWLILHFKEFDRPDDSKKVQQHFGKICKEYDPKGSKTPNCHALIEHIDEAEKRADVQLENRKDEGDPFGAPSTTVGFLIRAIREAAVKSR